jgi:uracil-DNA glycosylase
MALRKFYTRVISCPLTAKECPYALKNFAKGDIPRGFSFKEKAHPDILVVRKNPGHADKAEKEYYRGRKGKSLFKALTRYHHGKNIIRPKGSNRFSINERRYLLFILGYHKQLVPFKTFQIQDNERKKISQRVFFTNLFKCSTEDEQATIPKSAFSVCYERYFLEELRLVKPRLILAAGREVYNFLQRKEKVGQITVPIIYIKHPSYFYSKENESPKLKKIKRSVKKILNDNTN